MRDAISSVRSSSSLGREHARGEPALDGLGAAERVAGEHHLHALAHPAHPRVVLQVGRAEPHRGVADLGVLGDVDDVAPGGELAATREAVAVHLCDHRLREVPDAGPVAGDLTLELTFAGREPVGGRAGVGRIAAEVVARGEALARAADDRHAHVGIGVGFAEREDDLAAQRRVERVALLGPVQRDAPHHRRGVVHQDHGVAHVASSRSSPTHGRDRRPRTVPATHRRRRG